MKNKCKWTNRFRDFFEPVYEGTNNSEAKVLAVFLLILAAAAFYGSFPAFFYAGGVLLKKKAVLFLMAVAVCVCAILFPNPFSERINISVNTVLLTVMPVFAFFLAEYVMGISSPWKMDLKYVILNVMLYMIIAYGVFALTFSTALSVDTVCLLAYLFAVANVYLIRFRQIPLMVSDFSVAGTAANVASGFNYDPSIRMLLGGVLLAAVFFCSFRLRRNLVLAKNAVLRLTILCCYTAGLLMFVFLSFRNEAQFLKDHASINTFRPYKSYRKHGGMITLYSSIRLMLVKRPDGYSAKKVEKIAEAYPSDSVDSVDMEKLPNVIVILDEAFNDLGTLGELKTSQPVAPFYDSLKKKDDALTGTAYVSVFGGQTANTEFEFLTGNTKAFLPSGSTPYQLFIKDYVPSLTGQMKSLGACGMLAMHPFRASGYNRVAVYDNLGFSRFITQDDFPKDAYRIRDLISDQADFERIIQEYEGAKKKDDRAPFYLFNVTMQSHSPYDRTWYNVDRAIEIRDKKLQDKEAEQYLDVIHASDAAFQKLTEYFAKTDDPTVICFWGDHMPGLSDGFYEKLMGKSPDDLTDEESMALYSVPFAVWANYDIDETELKSPISMSYLKALMCSRCGIPMSGFDKFLLDLSKDIPVINGFGYFGADGKYYDFTDEKSPYYDRLTEYACMTYNHLFDKKHRSDVFELKEEE